MEMFWVNCTVLASSLFVKLLRSICGTLESFFLIIGVVMYHGNQPYIVTNTNGDTIIIAAYPTARHHQDFSSAIYYQNQVVSTMSFNTTSANVTRTTAGAFQGDTSVTHLNQGPPPAYQENEEVVEIS